MAGAPGLGEVDVHHDLARDIGKQVEMMVLDAKRRSESMVGKELQKMKTKMESMSEKIVLITERVTRMESSGGGLQKAELQESIAKLEEVWEGEVEGLKHELWQTIQAHNHNADLLKHHKDAIDQVQGQMTDAAPSPELVQAHAQLSQVDKVIQREQAKEQQMDQLMQRLTVVQQQLSAGAGPWAGGGAGAGMAPPFPMAQTAAQQAAAGSSGAAKRGQRKAAVTAKATKSASLLASAMAAPLRAEAPEFAPTVSKW